MDDAAGLEFDDDEDEECAKESVVGLKEVTGPGLGGCPWMASQPDVLEDCGLTNPNAEFPEMRSAPQPMLSRYICWMRVTMALAIGGR